MTLFSKPPTVDNTFLLAKQDPRAEKTGEIWIQNIKHAMITQLGIDVEQRAPYKFSNSNWLRSRCKTNLNLCLY